MARMYYKHLFTTTAALALASTAAFADGPSVSVTELPITATSGQTGFVGGSVGLEYGRSTSQTNESNEQDLDHRSQSVSLEYAATPKLAFAVDLENQSMSGGSLRAEGAVATLHGIYTLNRNVKIGAWVTSDKSLENLKIDGINYPFPDTYGKGVEVAYKTGALEVQGFWGTWSSDGIDSSAVTQTGISADYSFDSGFSLVAGMDRMSNEYGAQGNQFFGGEYEMANGAVLYAQRATATASYIGNINFTSTATSFGVRFDFGPNSGTTFRLRDIQDLNYLGVQD